MSQNPSILSGLSRRRFLTGAAAATTLVASDMTVLNVLQSQAMADELKKNQKRVILLWLAGGASQLETFDPKPGTANGGPFRAIPTNIPGVHISELMPKLAQRMQNTCIIRSLDTGNGDHGGGARLMHLGRRDEPTVKYPDLGAVIARELGRVDSQVPDYVSFYTATEGRGSAISQSGFLGARYNAMFLTEGSTPPNLRRLEQLSDVDHQERADLRKILNERFIRARTSSSMASHNEAYARVRGLMASEELFDLSKESQAMRDKYGPTLFAEQCLIARRLVEAGTPFVKVSRAWWDSHGQNFETHLELVSELDHVMTTLLDDLSDRGLLENTLVVTLSEFGRTPQINASLGRDHFASAWSVSLSGCGIKGGAVYGKSTDDGREVAEGKIGAAELFATIFKALGINHHKDYFVGARPLPLTDPGTNPVNDVLA
ncbi:protein of unknown function DUF1501 [Pirellula staleyi DSM 6068]|uniref:DUF1501 domain-containing protein n=1 Tax=Pirellula staleyi (strain ATCC 27377 / DSM 6068 / ICPB 4128) TaxID=530564 RepID=D2R4H4_PIRSD|nr:DUF1501 domain-containing protein [Pirellula staleyi]ADB15322.1 protein of unknown function DUF1501 [Pirellula staleyi DSM 6068]